MLGISKNLLGLSLALVLSAGACAEANPPRLGVAEPKPRTEGSIRLATYNIENLFDDRDDLSLTDRNDDCHSRDKTVRAKPESQLLAVAETIRRLDADVIGLQEIESFDALNEFRVKYLDGLGYDYIVSIDVGQERGIEQAVLSRFPITHAEVWPNMELGGIHPEKYGDKKNWYAGQPIRYRRSPLHVRIDVPAERAGGEAYQLELFVVHHKSGRYNDYWRDKEAAALVRLLGERMAANPGVNIAVLGDFNAMPDAASVKQYVTAGMRHVIEGETRTAKTTSHSSGRAIDFILVNGGLSAELVADSAFVLGTPQIPEGADYRSTPKPEGYASDHMPLAVDIMPRDK